MQPIRPGAQRARGGDADYREPVRPQPQRPLGPGRLRRGEEGDAPGPPRRSPPPPPPRLCQAVGVRGALRGAATGTQEAEGGEGTEGTGTREGQQRGPWDRLS